MRFDRRTLLIGLTAGAAGVAEAQTSANVRHHGLLLRTPELDAALAFYGDGLGFALADYEPRAGWARLVCNLPLYLETAPQGRLPGPTESRAGIVLQVNDLDVTLRHVRAAGARQVGERYNAAPGPAARFADNAGLLGSAIQPTSPTPPFTEPRIYNTGLYVPAGDIAPTRALLEQHLGFAAMTERFFPPSIPYLEADRSFAFMLHHQQPGEPEMVARPDPRSDDLGAWQVFVARDLAAAARAALAGGATALDRRPRRFPMGRRQAFVTPGGAPFELWSWT